MMLVEMVKAFCILQAGLTGLIEDPYAFYAVKDVTHFLNF